MRTTRVAGVVPVFMLFVAGGLGAQQAGERDQGGEMPSFRHETHRAVECTACHGTDGEEHPDLTVQDCRSCHHSGEASASCTTCHAPGDVSMVTREVTRTMDIRLGDLNEPRRTLLFRHAAHEDLSCEVCHTEGVALSAARLDCTVCHELHHEPTTQCRDCHEPPAPGAHTRQVHLGCGGSGCHEAAPATIRNVPRTREFCLVCHTGMVYHKPGQPCASCHQLPPPEQDG